MNALDIKIRKEAIKSSVVLGLILLSLNIFLFYLITSISKSPMMVLVIGPQLLSIVLPLFIAILLSINIRKKVGGYWTFKQAATGIFILFLIAYLVKIIGNDLVFDKFIEPHSVEKIQAADIDAKIIILQQKHSSEKEITQAIGDLKKYFATQQNVSVWSIIQGDVMFILFLFLFALAMASFLRNAKYVPASAEQ